MQIASGVHSIGPGPGGYTQGGYSHAYLVDELTLVDTLWETTGDAVIRYLWRIQRPPTDVKRIVLTHAHRSHLGGLAALKELTGARVLAHAAEAPIIEGRMRAHSVSFWPLRPVSLLPFRLGAFLGVPKHVPCVVDETLEDGDTVGPLQAIHTPGHTPGHVAFHWPERRTLIAGDAVATWPRFGPGWPGFNLDEEQYRISLDRLIDLEPEVVGTGHGEPVVERTAARLATRRTAPPRGSGAGGNSRPRLERVVHRS
jgi:glyoxylase-like metal-dependent hydrolase (beta-lactamase superfamily II)